MTQHTAASQASSLLSPKKRRARGFDIDEEIELGIPKRQKKSETETETTPDQCESDTDDQGREESLSSYVDLRQFVKQIIQEKGSEFNKEQREAIKAFASSLSWYMVQRKAFLYVGKQQEVEIQRQSL